MNGVAHARELGAFLKARRSALIPGAVGLADEAQRRVTGLRREEKHSPASATRIRN